jgi:hypothetical protein
VTGDGAAAPEVDGYGHGEDGEQSSREPGSWTMPDAQEERRAEDQLHERKESSGRPNHARCEHAVAESSGHKRLTVAHLAEAGHQQHQPQRHLQRRGRVLKACAPILRHRTAPIYGCSLSLPTVQHKVFIRQADQGAWIPAMHQRVPSDDGLR